MVGSNELLTKRRLGDLLYMIKRPIYHSDGGEEPCNQIAFYFTCKDGFPIYVDEVILLDGSHPAPNRVLSCGACGGAVGWPREAETAFLVVHDR